MASKCHCKYGQKAKTEQLLSDSPLLFPHLVNHGSEPKFALLLPEPSQPLLWHHNYISNAEQRDKS